MARPISDEELQLKKRARRRLVGAIVLVTAVAVVLPMVLDSEPRPSSQNVDIHIPAPDSGEFKPKGPAAQSATDATAAKAVSESKTDAPPAPVSPIADPPPPPEKVATSKAAAPERSSDRAGKAATASEGAARKSASAPAGAYVVQVAALADAAKAKQLEKRLSGAGLKAYTEVVKTQAGAVTRVRAGPYPSREAAEKARTQLKKAGLDGQVMPK